MLSVHTFSNEPMLALVPASAPDSPPPMRNTCALGYLWLVMMYTPLGMNWPDIITNEKK